MGEGFNARALCGSQPDQNRIPLTLKQGWDKLMLKNEKNYGGDGFYARILDNEDSLVISTTKPK